MKRMVLFSRDDTGYSLVELIVSILIMSVITGMIIILISTSRKTYQTVNRDAVIQEETELVRNFINEIAIEAVDCGQFGTNAPTDTDDMCIWFLAPDNVQKSDNYYYYFFLLEKATNTLRYGRYIQMEDSTNYNRVLVQEVTDPGSGGTKKVVLPEGFDYLKLLENSSNVDKNGKSTSIAGDDCKLLAQYVTGISCRSEQGLIKVTLNMEFDGAEFTKNLMFNGRNMKKTVSDTTE